VNTKPSIGNVATAQATQNKNKNKRTSPSSLTLGPEAQINVAAFDVLGGIKLDIALDLALGFRGCIDGRQIAWSTEGCPDDDPHWLFAIHGKDSREHVRSPLLVDLCFLVGMYVGR
jgi:hypothetical protein